MRGTGDRHKPLTMAEATAEFENILLHCNIQGYLHEPEYSEEELRRIEEEAAAAAAEQALPVAEEPDRAGVNWWCTCLLCSPMETHKESLCCSESQRCQFLRDEMAESGEEGAVCVTSHPGFTPHLNRWVLDTYFRTQKVNWKRQPKPAGRNGRLSTELTSYRHFLEWILQGERLGRGNRLVLPACVVQAIRANYPTQDGQYRGYQETVDAQDEL
ncbi:uncharacterized protein LOC115555775 [Gadus morhua]|uniref:uncharacterized protein LOC115555775 n=1 Tax=Gadus morhua TaxID=8049 RepID=UPI0011B77C5E|nr:uncharacterized protein LOC115555775 [Gadus morhua]